MKIYHIYNKRGLNVGLILGLELSSNEGIICVECIIPGIEYNYDRVITDTDIRNNTICTKCNQVLSHDIGIES